MTDPFDALADPPLPQEPRPSFTRALRARLVDALGVDPIDLTAPIHLPDRRPMSETSDAASTGATTTGDERVIHDDRSGTGGGIWAGAFYADCLGAIDVLVDVFGFERQIVVTGPDDVTVVHSQLRWPEGGIVQAGTHDPDNPFSHAPGQQSLYVVTADPDAVWQRCQAAGLEVLRAPEEPDYAPGTTVFAVKDPEGNIWSFGSYGLGQTG